MYNVTKIYICTKSKMEIYAPEDMTVSAVKDRISLNTSIYISVTYEGSSVALDFCKLITDYPVMPCSSWDEFNNQLTDKLVIGYTCHLPGYVPGTNNQAHPVRTWDMMSTIGVFDIAYADNDSENSNVFALRHLMHDLKVTVNTNSESYPALDKCIPVVNGFVCRPVFKSGSLYILNGAELCRTDVIHKTPELQLLDFSDIGEIVYTNIGDTVDKYTAKAKITDTSISLSTYYSLREYTPIVVLAGMMVLPENIEVSSEYLLSVDFDSIPINTTLNYRAYCLNDNTIDSEVGYKSVSVSDYIASNSDDCFIIFVKTPRLFVDREVLTSFNNGYTVDNFKDNSIMINRSTGLIKNYHSDTYNSKKVLSVQQDEDLYVVDNQWLITSNDCKHHNFRNITKCKYEMLYISGE